MSLIPVYNGYGFTYVPSGGGYSIPQVAPADVPTFAVIWGAMMFVVLVFMIKTIADMGRYR